MIMKNLLLPILSVCFGITQASILDLKITEIMYHPTTVTGVTEKQLEYIELKNTGATVLNLRSLIVSGGIQFTFFSDYILQPNEFAVLVSDSNVFHTRYPAVNIAGQYSSNLANSGEELILFAGSNKLIAIDYKDDLPWSPLADGLGYSLVPTEVNPTTNQESSKDWKNSCNILGSPGEDDPVCNKNFPDVWVNKVLSHTDLPQVDAIEIYNNSSVEADISDWYLSDSKKDPYQYKIPTGTTIQPGEYYLIDENAFNPNGLGFRFNRSGDEIYLFSSNNSNELTGFVTGWEFEAQYNGHSFGVYINSEGEKHFVPQQELTLGFENADPKIGPLVFTQIMYNPNAIQHEFLKIKNITDSTVNLWHPGTPEIGWAISGVSFTFPAGVSLDSNESLYLTNTNPQIFKTDNSVSDSIQVFQFLGKLSNSSEDVSIWAHDRQDTTSTGDIFMTRVLLETVNYTDENPWPAMADGYGYFLKRKVDTDYGNDPLNWKEESDFTDNVNEANKLNNTYVSNNILYCSNSEIIQGTVKIFDIKGSMIFSKSIQTKNFQINIKNWANGMYVLKFESGSNMTSTKFIK